MTSAIALIVATSVVPSHAASFACPGGVKGVGDETTKYQGWGEHCEGLYERWNQGVVGLYVVSLVEVTSSGSLGGRAGATLPLQWSKTGPENVLELTLQGEADPASQHYRFDARFRVSQGSFEWPMKVVDALKISAAEVDMKAFATGVLPGFSDEPVYAPLRLGQLAGQTSDYEFGLRCSGDIASLSYSIAQLNGSSWIQKSNNTPLPKVPRMARRTFTARIPASTVPDKNVYYQVTFSGTLRSSKPGKQGRPFTQSFFFYHG